MPLPLLYPQSRPLSRQFGEKSRQKCEKPLTFLLFCVITEAARTKSEQTFAFGQKSFDFGYGELYVAIAFHRPPCGVKGLLHRLWDQAEPRLRFSRRDPRFLRACADRFGQPWRDRRHQLLYFGGACRHFTPTDGISQSVERKRVAIQNNDFQLFCREYP